MSRTELCYLGFMGYHVEQSFLIPAQARDFEGFLQSPLLGRVRLRRERVRPDRWSYRLDVGNAS